MPGSPDVVIVGGGVIGAACARELASTGRRVRLIERGGEAGEAWRASAGLLAPQIEVADDDPLFELGVLGREFYRTLAEELRETTGVDIGAAQEGILQLATRPEDASLLRERVAWQRQQGQATEWVEPSELRGRWPWLCEAFGALYALRDGYVDPVRLVEALRADAIRRGAELVQDDITTVRVGAGRLAGVAGGATHAAATVVLAAGAWSGRLRGLPRPLSVEPVRGQLVAYRSPPRVSPVFGAHGYLLPRRDETIAGSTMEYAGFVAATTEAGVRGIRERAGELVPELRSVEPVRAWAGLRPGTPDGRPIVGADPELPGLWYATGHGRNGILYAGVTARLIRQLMAGEPVLEAAALLRPERFWNW